MKWLNEQGSLLKDFLAGGFRRTLWFCALGLLLTVLLGVGIGLLVPEQAAQTMNSFMEQIEQSGVITSDGQMSVFALLMNNWRAMLVSAAYGVYLCRNMCRMVTNHPGRAPLLAVREDLLRVMVMIVAPLTVAAAFVECYVTPVIMALFL